MKKDIKTILDDGGEKRLDDGGEKRLDDGGEKRLDDGNTIGKERATSGLSSDTRKVDKKRHSGNAVDSLNINHSAGIAPTQSQEQISYKHLPQQETKKRNLSPVEVNNDALAFAAGSNQGSKSTNPLQMTPPLPERKEKRPRKASRKAQKSTESLAAEDKLKKDCSPKLPHQVLESKGAEPHSNANWLCKPSKQSSQTEEEKIRAIMESRKKLDEIFSRSRRSP